MSGSRVGVVEEVWGRKAEDRAALERSLSAALGAARAAWPGLSLGDKAFLRHLARHVPAERASSLERVHVADLFLAAACTVGEPSAIASFERDFLSRVPKVIARVERVPAAVDELLQSLRVSLLTGPEARIAQYSGSGPLHGWVRAVALNAAIMTKRPRRESPHASRDLSEKALAGKLDPEAALVRERHRGLFQESLSAALRSLEPRERNLLRAYFVDEMTIDRLAVRFRVHRATAARRVHAARQRLLDETRRRVGERVPLTASEFDSLAAMLKSELSLSFSGG
jgi:RNA polymerase sigma-70 factor (ECF subfamily)